MCNWGIVSEIISVLVWNALAKSSSGVLLYPGYFSFSHAVISFLRTASQAAYRSANQIPSMREMRVLPKETRTNPNDVENLANWFKPEILG